MSSRQTKTKTLLWAIVGALAVVTLARFVNGLGVTTGLSDAAPWGLWIAFDVMAGVALAAGGFVLAGTVYVFHLERFRQFVRPAVLTAFLGYVAVAIGLLYDLGLPWHIWHPVAFPQPRSVLFEVAMCVILYLTVLLLEFSPVLLEHRLFGGCVFQGIHKILKRATIPLVITGIVLSTLHQSSLGSLFLIAPHRVHPLWYSPLIWVLFFVSAVGLGLMMVTLESFFSAWYFGHRLRMDLLSKLGRAASVVLLLYAGLRLTDLAVRGVLSTALDRSPQTLLFGFELLVSAVLPGVMLAVPRLRNSPRGLGVAATMTVLGIVGYRFNLCIVTFMRPEGMSYFPTWMELVVSAGIVSVALLLFIFFVENLKVYPEGTTETIAPQVSRPEPAAAWSLLPGALAGPRRYSLALVLGAAGAVALLPEEAVFGARAEPTPVSRVRMVEGARQPRLDGPGDEILLASTQGAIPDDAQATSLMAIDGNQDGCLVLFAHDDHVSRLGNEDSCNSCHHQNLPFHRNTSCSECHRDMYGQTDIFDHASHIEKLDGNSGCSRCHRDAEAHKTRAAVTPCLDCHEKMLAQGSMIQLREGNMTGLATGYMDAMHGLCVDCHETKAKQPDRQLGSDFLLCTNCHREVDGTQLRHMEPYASSARDPAVVSAEGPTRGGG